MSEKSIEEIEKDNSEALEKAMEELDELAKSKEEPTDELDDLTKSLEEELGEDLTKSEKEPDGDEDDKGAEPVGQDEDDEDMDKSSNENYDEELVKASDAFASLEKSVSEMGFGVAAEMSEMRKSMAALLNLNIKQAKVIASLAKSRQEDMERIEKSVGTLVAIDGKQPVAPGLAKFGMGGVEAAEELTKSISEISDSLTKAVQAGQVDARHLSIFGTYKDVGRLPDDVKKIIGL